MLKSAYEKPPNGGGEAVMRETPTDRTKALIGGEGVAALRASSVLVCGLGGVGGYALEALVRAGVGRIGVLDGDVITPSNLNRQILATVGTLGMKKTEAAKERALSVSPECEVETYDLFYLPDTAERVDLTRYDWVIDAVDTVAAKVELICRAKAQNVNIVSSMGTGNKLSADFVIKDISETTVCPLARAVRKQLRERGVTSGVDVLFSTETPRGGEGRVPSSISYVPAIAGLMLAGYVIGRITGEGV